MQWLVSNLVLAAYRRLRRLRLQRHPVIHPDIRLLLGQFSTLRPGGAVGGNQRIRVPG